MQPTLFSSSLEDALDRARFEPIVLGHKFVEPGHLMLTLSAYAGSPVTSTLKAYRLDYAKVRPVVEDYYQQFTWQGGCSTAEFSPAVQEIIDAAVDVAQRNRNQQMPTYLQHLLIALIESYDQCVEKIFVECGACRDDVRRRLDHELANFSSKH